MIEIHYEQGWWNVTLDGILIDGFDCEEDAYFFSGHIWRNNVRHDEDADGESELAPDPDTF